MSAWSDEKAATALRLIQKRGMTMTVKRRVVGAQSSSGDRAAPQPVASAAGVYLPGEGSSDVEGQVVKSDRILLSATDPAPEAGDIVTVPSGPHAGDHLVKKAKVMAPDGGTIYSALEVGG